jgi:hypothetical protein
MRHCAAVLEEVLADAGLSLDLVVPDLHFLPNGVVGMAFGATCNRLALERRNAIATWITNQDHERSDAERAYALPGLLDSSPTEAFRAMYLMRASPSPAKDQRERLASVLTGVPADKLGRMFSDQKEHEVRKVVVLLLIAAQEGKADRDTRTAILAGIIPVMARLSLYRGSIGADVRKHVQAVMRSLDGLSLKHIRESLIEKAPDALKELFDEAPPNPAQERGPIPVAVAVAVPVAPLPIPVSQPAQPAPPSSLDAQSPPGPAGDTGDQQANQPPPHLKPDPLAWFDANIQMLAHAREFYLAARTEADLEHRRREDAERAVAEHSRVMARLSTAEAHVRELAEQLAQAMEGRNRNAEALKALTEDLQRERNIRQTSERALLDSKEEFGHERAALQRRIDVNAEARVNDFRIAVSGALTPIVRDVPLPGSERAADLGPGLLVCIDQIIRALSEKGIELRRSAAEKR